MKIKAFYRSLSRGQKLAFWAIISPIGLGLCAGAIAIASWFGEPTGKKIVEGWFDTETPTQTVTLSPTSSMIATASQTTTMTAPSSQKTTPTLTSIISQSSTISPSPTPVCALQGYTLWSEFLESAPVKPDGCLDFSKWGIAAIADGIQIFNQPTTRDYHYGIYTILPNEPVEIRFTIKIDEIEGNSFGYNTDLYFGFVNPLTKDPSGEFIYYLITRIDPNVYIVHKSDLIPNSEFYLKANYQIGTTQEIVMRRNDFTLDISIVGIKEDRLLGLPNANPLNYLWIGYNVPNGGKLSATVSIPVITLIK